MMVMNEKHLVGADETVTVLADRVVTLTEALRLTVEYVGLGLLHPSVGWDWYEALKSESWFDEWLGRMQSATTGNVCVSPEWFCMIDPNDSLTVAANGIDGIDVTLTEHGMHSRDGCNCGRHVALSKADVLSLVEVLTGLAE